MAINTEKDVEDGGRYLRFREAMRKNPLLDTTWRIGVFTVGATVLLAGLAMMVLPGPGFLGIIVGLAILATEFVWAQSALNKARVAAEKAKERALDPKTRLRNTIIAVVLGILAGAALIAYLRIVGTDLPWNVDWSEFNTR